MFGFAEFSGKLSSNLEGFPALVFHSDLNATGGMLQGTGEFRMEFPIYCYCHQVRFGKPFWELKVTLWTLYLFVWLCLR